MIYLWLVLGLCLLAFGGNTMVSGAVALAKKMGISTLLIGLTLIGFGTSTPELLTSLLAVIKGSNGIALGNVVGSNTANILLVLGLSAIISPVVVDVKAFKRDGGFLALSCVMLVLALLLGQISRLFGGVLVAMLVGYIVYSYITDKQQNASAESTLTTEPKTSVWLDLIKTVGGIALMMLGAKLLVDNAIILARSWGVSEAVIGLTIVAVGTSLPELAASVISAFKGHTDVAFGNVVGSNIYNALFILGITAVFYPIAVPQTMGADVWIMTAITAVLIGIAVWQKRFSRFVGFAFLGTYVLYNYYLYTLPM
ncbi:MAG: calcium/sodium antiporter [Alphaproteobacteria bacterium]|nr:calcium/sodium antiporter [Alphaproteobacteria bacterium]